MHAFNLAEAVSILPDDLADLLVRGAYLDYSARMLENRRREQSMRLESVRASQPPFLFLRPKETRAAFKEAAQDTSADLSALDHAANVNKKLGDHLRARSAELLEHWLRAHCEEYRLGLAAGRFREDWTCSHLRFTGHANQFIQALGSARNMAPAGYDRVRGMFSQAAYQAISLAHVAAVRVEAEIAAMNAIADEHDQRLGQTVFADPMPRLVPEPYAATVAQIATLPVAGAQSEFTRVIAAVEDLLGRESDVARNRVRSSAEDHLGRTRSYLRDVWNQLHAHALAHSVDVEQVGTVVEQTERLYPLGAPPMPA